MNTEKEKIISKVVMDRAEKLSAEWNATAFIIININNNLDAMVWNHYKDEKPQPTVFAHVDSEGWKLSKEGKEQGYKFELIN